MTRAEFLRNVSTWDELLDIIEEVGFEHPFQSIYTSEQLLDNIQDDIRYNWNLDDLITFCNDLDTGYSYHIETRGTYYGSEDADDYFEEWKERVDEYCCEEGYFDPEPEDEDEDDEVAQPVEHVLIDERIQRNEEDELQQSEFSLDYLLSTK